ncbi:MAG TPA: bacterioferritin [Xanthobacteraceae bacterium]
MIVCSCNVFSDHDVRTALTDPDSAPRRTGQVYECLGCNPHCGRCARTIKQIMEQALASTAPCACCPGGRHRG